MLHAKAARKEMRNVILPAANIRDGRNISHRKIESIKIRNSPDTTLATFDTNKWERSVGKAEGNRVTHFLQNEN